MSRSGNIKDYLKPKLGKIKQGYYKPTNLEKYLGDPNKIIYRSSWEFKFMRYCDDSPSVVYWANEPLSIPYINPLSKTVNNYWVDFMVVLKTKEGEVKKWLLDVKPMKYLTPPATPNRMTDKQTQSYMYAAKQYVLNKAKFEAAKDFASCKNMRFGIITEEFLFKDNF